VKYGEWRRGAGEGWSIPDRIASWEALEWSGEIRKERDIIPGNQEPCSGLRSVVDKKKEEEGGGMWPLTRWSDWRTSDNLLF
jgi:hypothetical protein